MPVRARALAAVEPITAQEQAEWEVLRNLQAEDRERTECQDSLLAFFRRAWREVDPAPFEENWHHEVLAEVLEDVARGYIRDAVINIPPRMGKSLLVSVMWPAWIWIQEPEPQYPLTGPHCSFLAVSYGATLAEVAAVKMQRLVNGEWYQRLWGHRVKMREDQASRTDFGNYAGGERISNSIEGGILGRGGLIQICFPYDEIIWTENGPLPIGRVVERKLTLRAWSLGADGFELKPIVGWWRNPGRRLLRIRCGDRYLRSTEDHRLYTDRGIVRARDLIAGDRLISAPEPLPQVVHQGAAHAEFGRNVVETTESGSDLQALGGRENGAPASRGVYPEVVDVFPRSPRANRADDRRGNAVPLRQETSTFAACGDLAHKRDVEVGDAVSKPAVFFYVGDVLRARAIGKSLKARIRAVAVNMTNFLARRAGTKKGQCDDAMDLAIKGLAVAPKCDAGIPVARRRGHQAATQLFTGFAFPRQTANPTKIGDLVPGESWHRHPTLIRVDAVEVLYDVPSATYCVSIEGNRNMVMSPLSIVTSNCDDPHKLDGVESDSERERTIRAISEGLTTRITDPRISARVLVMQRLHQLDATDYALNNWRRDMAHVMLPMRFSPDYASPLDRRTKDGELLWPKVWTEESVQREEQELGPYAAAGQLQQVPVPRGGGIFKSDWLEPWPPLNSDGSFPHEMVREGRIIYPALEYVVACVDTAFGTKQTNDRSAMAVLGIFRGEGHGRIERRGDSYIRIADDHGFAKVLLLYGWAKRLELHGPPQQAAEVGSDPKSNLARRQEDWGLVEWVVDTCRRYRVDHLKILTLGQGHGLAQELRRLHSDESWGVEMETEQGDKLARAYAVQHLFSSHQIYFPMYEDGGRPKWCAPLIDELLMFPRGRFDDFIDSIVGALRHLRDTGILDRREEFARDEAQTAAWRPNRRTALPYDLIVPLTLSLSLFFHSLFA